MRDFSFRTSGLAEVAGPFLRAGVVQLDDVLIVDAVAARFGEARPEVLLAFALAIGADREGDVGVDLLRAPERAARADALRRERLDDSADGGAADDASPEDDARVSTLAWPADVGRWQQAALDSGLRGPGAPFASQSLRDGRTLVMTRRTFREQERLVAGLERLTKATPAVTVDAAAVEAGLARFALLDPDFDVHSEAADAVRVAASGSLTIITGGPGTGKTYSVKRLLALLLAEGADMRARPVRVAMAAPSGKAAARMVEALVERLHLVAPEGPVRATLQGIKPTTLHGLLGMRVGGPPQRHAGSPIPADVVVIDETSMVSLVALRQVVEAVPSGSRLVLLGDRDQLASVEAGTALADLVGGAFLSEASAPRRRSLTGPLAGRVVRFTYSHRTRDAPTIGAIMAEIQTACVPDQAPAVVASSLARAVSLLTARDGTPVVADPLPGRVRWLGAGEVGASGWRRPSEAQLHALSEPYEQGYVSVLRGVREWTEPAQRAVLDAFGAYRVLAVHRRGPLGVDGLEEALGERVRAALKARPAGGWWRGQPVLITKNTPDVGLYNGDVGLILPSRGAAGGGSGAGAGRAASGGAAVAVFPDGLGAREVRLSSLPAHAGALAMTVHKAQGSQFAHVALVLAGRDSPIQTRELVYTGVTRTSGRLTWLGSEDELVGALNRPVGRLSGLSERVWRA